MYLKFYNAMAEILREITDCAPPKFFVDYEVLSPHKRKRINEELREALPELFDSGTGQYIEIIFHKERYTEDFFVRLTRLRKNCIKNSDYALLVCLLEKLDQGLEKRAEAELELGEEFKFIKMLNGNGDDTKIQLLPRAMCSWERSSRGRQHFSSLGNYLRNYYYIDMKEAKGYKFRHVLISSGVFSDAYANGRLRIGVSPINNSTDLKLKQYELEHKELFALEGLSDSEALADNIKRILDRAASEHVDIMVFPEMLGTEEICEMIKEDLEALFFNGFDQYPALVVMPSIWKNHTNTSVVLNHYGEEVCRNQKQTPFVYTGEDGLNYQEDLSADGIVYVFHCKRIGRIVLPICKDFLNRDYRRMLTDMLKATLIISPSFSTGNYDFLQVMLSSGYIDCCAAWINTCSAQRLSGAKEENFDIIGAFYVTGKNSDIGFVKLNRKEGCKLGSCSAACLFIQDIPLCG